MAILSDVYKTRNNREIVLTPFQAQVFEATIEKFKRDGVGGDDIFEETYVLQKRIAEFITTQLAQSSGNQNVSVRATQVYNNILGIESAVAVEPEPIVEPDPTPPPLPESPKIPVKKPVGTVKAPAPVREAPRNIPFRDLRTKPSRPSSMTEFLRRNPGALRPGSPMQGLGIIRDRRTGPRRPTSMAEFLAAQGGRIGQESPADGGQLKSRQRGILGRLGF